MEKIQIHSHITTYPWSERVGERDRSQIIILNKLSPLSKIIKWCAFCNKVKEKIDKEREKAKPIQLFKSLSSSLLQIHRTGDGGKNGPNQAARGGD